MCVYIYIYMYMYVCKYIYMCVCVCVCVYGFPGGSGVKNLPADAEDVGSNPESGRYPGEGNGNPL